MTVGIAVALVGSNPASSVLASLLTTTTDAFAQSTTSTTTDVSAQSTTSTMTVGVVTSTSTKKSSTATTSVFLGDDGTVEVATTTLPASEKPLIVGVQNNEVIKGVRSAAVRVFGEPLAVVAEFIMPNKSIHPIYPDCSQTQPSLLAGAIPGKNCYFSISTASFPNGEGYQLRGLAKYPDGSLRTTELVTFAIANDPMENKFLFISPAQYAKVAGYLQIRGAVVFATDVQYAIFNAKDTTSPITIKETEQIGDEWLHRWDTRTVANGNYVIEARITNQLGQRYKGGTVGVMVYNAQTTGSIATTTSSVAPQQTQEPAIEPAPIQAIIPTVDPTVPQQRPAMTIESERTPEAVDVSKPVINTPTIAPPIPVETKNAGFFQNVRNIFRSAITPQEDQTPEPPKPVVVTSVVVQRLEQVSSELKQASQDTGVVSQNELDRIVKDADGDGITDYQEIEALHTDPFKKDTDGDGVNDGIEVRQGTNPLDANRAIKIEYENAKLLGETVKPELLKIETVLLATTTEVVEVEVIKTTETGVVQTVKEKKEVIREKIKLAGKTLPYALVTLYIYSDIPTIVTVKADKNGSWSYALDKPLDDGQHQAYVTINDSSGKIVAKSQVVGFVKTAQAITVANIEGLAQAAGSENIGTVDESKRNFSIIVALVIGLGLLVGVFMVVRSFKNPDRDIV